MNNFEIQRDLQYLGFYFGVIDGKIGLQTKKAIKSFQKSFELTVDGIFGSNSEKKMISIIKQIQTKIGCSLIDGIVGSETIEKTKQFQLRNNLTIDGICGIKTRAKIFSSNNPHSWDDFAHFKKSEFSCRCGCGYSDEDLEVVEILEMIRKHFGNHPVIVTSGCRCVKHNNKVGGIKGSKHLEGKACDFYIQNVSTQNLLNYCYTLMNQGIIKYTYTNNKNMKGVVHINI